MLKIYSPRRSGATPEGRPVGANRRIIRRRRNLSAKNLVGVDLSHVNLSKVNLTGANLSKVNLTGANLTGSDLSGVKLVNANLTKSVMSEANLTEANLKDARHFNTSDTTGAIFCRTIMPDGSANNSGCSQ